MTWTLQRTDLNGGAYMGVLEGAGAPPVLELVHDGAVVTTADVTQIEGTTGQWQVRVALPLSLLSDGVQVAVIRTAGGDDILDRIAVFAGAEVDDDLRAEVQVLRAELDMLKAAVRRQARDAG